MQQNNAGQSRRGGRGGRGGIGGSSRERNCHTPDSAKFPRYITDKYFHTHGGCNHVSIDCTMKVEGYNDAASSWWFKRVFPDYSSSLTTGDKTCKI